MPEDAAVLSSRRQTARSWRIGLFAALVTVAAVGASRLIPAYERAVPVVFGGGMVTATIQLHCITPQQALDLASPLLRSGQPAEYIVRDLPQVTIRGVPKEFAGAKTAIETQDSKCQLPRPTTAPHFPR
jgi:hypothetical protein